MAHTHTHNLSLSLSLSLSPIGGGTVGWWNRGKLQFIQNIRRMSVCAPSVETARNALPCEWRACYGLTTCAHTHTHARRVRPRPRGIYHFSTYAECSVTANTVRMRANINALIYANGVVISFFFLFCIEFYTQQPTTISNSTNCVCVLCVSLRGSQFGYVTPPCAHTRFEWAANATGSSGNFSVIAGGGDSTSHNRSENRKYDR